MNAKIILLYSALLIAGAGLTSGCGSKGSKAGGTAKILVYSKTAGYRHDCIPVAITAIQKMGTENGFLTDFTEDSTQFNAANLKQYQAVVFLCTTHTVLSDAEQVDFQKYIEAGNGFVGIHAAADTEYDWPWYNKLLGAYFDSHPPQQQVAKIKVVDNTNISTSFLPAVWQRKDEWYNYKQFNPEVHVLLNLDESSYKGGNMGAQHPIAWYHAYDGGRSWYTGLGHIKEAYNTDSLFLQHLLGGIYYALGKTALPAKKV